jgi:hypothetical protein
MPQHVPRPIDLEEFHRTFLYREEAFLPDEILSIDAERREVIATIDTSREFPYVQYQRAGPGHPAHLSVAELIMATAHMGSLHGWFFYGLRWNDGWVGFGNRIHRADFKALALIGPPLELRSRETGSRVGPQRIVVRFEFDFRQEGKPVYFGDQTAMFLKTD